MRNNVKVLDPSAPNSITSLNAGEMFTYQDGRSFDNVYMKVFGHTIRDQAAVHLATGEIFMIAPSAKISRVSLLQVGAGAN